MLTLVQVNTYYDGTTPIGFNDKVIKMVYETDEGKNIFIELREHYLAISHGDISIGASFSNLSHTFFTKIIKNTVQDFWRAYNERFKTT